MKRRTLLGWLGGLIVLPFTGQPTKANDRQSKWSSYEMTDFKTQQPSIMHERTFRRDETVDLPELRPGWKRADVILIQQGDTCRLLLFDKKIFLT